MTENDRKTIRLGILVAAKNTVVEPEMNKMTPEGVTIHFGRLFMSKSAPTKVPEEEYTLLMRNMFDELADDVPRETKKLSVIRPKLKVIAYACNSCTFYRGIDFERELVRRMEAASDGIPGITEAGAEIEALKELGLKKLCMISPYPEYQQKLAIDFLTKNGFELVSVDTLATPSIEHDWQPPAVVRDQAITACKGLDCDGVYSCCSAVRTIEIIEEVERELGKPMISGNQATMWLMLKKAGFKKPVDGFGTLLRQL